MDEEAKPSVDKDRRIFILRWVALIVVVGITLFVFSIRDQAEKLAFLGYPGIFLVALGVAVVFAMGGLFNPAAVALAAGAGGALGELSGYLAGFSGQAVVERMDIYDRMLPWIKRFGGFAILILSAIPNPFFDIAGITAGMLKMPLGEFLFFTWIGQTIKMFMFAYAGAFSINKVFHW
jgi:membrane protein DedA with SNARE-associated domain